jgi:hypothetical protein
MLIHWGESNAHSTGKWCKPDAKKKRSQRMIGFTVHYPTKLFASSGYLKALETLIPYFRGSYGDKGFEI